MALTSERKKEIITQYGGSETNTGSVEAQIAMLTTRIAAMTEHLNKQKNDKNTLLSLMKLVGQRKSFLGYLMKKDILKYRELIQKLNLRK